MANDERRSSDEKLRVMVVDDHALFRRGLEMVLQEEPDLELVGEASDGNEAVERAQELMPDVVLMDVRMPNLDGIEATRQIVATGNPARILMLTTFDLDEYVYAAIRAGASGALSTVIRLMPAMPSTTGARAIASARIASFGRSFARRSARTGSRARSTPAKRSGDARSGSANTIPTPTAAGFLAAMRAINRATVSRGQGH